MKINMLSSVKKIKITELIKEMKNSLNDCYNINDARKFEKYFLMKIKKIECADKYIHLEYGLYFTRREIAKYLEELIYKVYERNGIFLRECYEE